MLAKRPETRADNRLPLFRVRKGQERQRTFKRRRALPTEGSLEARRRW